MQGALQQPFGQSGCCGPGTGPDIDLLSYVANAEVCLPSNVFGKTGQVAGLCATFCEFFLMAGPARGAAGRYFSLVGKVTKSTLKGS